MKVYCDTNIFIDYFDERTDRLRPLKEFAFNFFSRGWNCNFELIISDWLINELSRHLDEKQYKQIFNEFEEKGKLHVVNKENSDVRKAKNTSKHWDDALHAVLANKAGADYLSTRNIKHYSGCEELVSVVLPEFI
jgi:predicted nucleic acid-binding protein